MALHANQKDIFRYLHVRNARKSDQQVTHEREPFIEDDRRENENSLRDRLKAAVKKSNEQAMKIAFEHVESDRHVSGLSQCLEVVTTLFKVVERAYKNYDTNPGEVEPIVTSLIKEFEEIKKEGNLDKETINNLIGKYWDSLYAVSVIADKDIASVIDMTINSLKLFYSFRLNC